MRLKTQQSETALLKTHPTLSLWFMIQRWAFICIGALVITAVLLYIHFDFAFQYVWRFYYPYALAISGFLFNAFGPFNNEVLFWRHLEKKRHR